ncbi:hypothetical protein [Streptomyces sp. NPDC047928]|uniref:hypothetical protein n=1 Tax=unclassified Streptomyces TaxID=2593676 RepID=UPI003714B598
MGSTGTTNHPSDCDVSVQLSECGREDAHTVFDALDHVFAACDEAAPGPAAAATAGASGGREPTVWVATFDSSTGSARSGEEPAAGRAHRLTTPVTALLTGGQHAVDEVEKALARIFDVRSTQSVSGEHEKESRLLLASR